MQQNNEWTHYALSALENVSIDIAFKGVEQAQKTRMYWVTKNKSPTIADAATKDYIVLRHHNIDNADITVRDNILKRVYGGVSYQ